MGFWDKVKEYAPLALPIAGGAAFGPLGMAGGAAVGGIIAANSAADKQRQANEQNIAMQREFAQMGIQWKVNDAKAAGIHPLAALGAQTNQFTANIGAEPTPDLAGMGQDIYRAAAATQTADQRALSTLQIQSAQLDLEGKALDNQLKQSQLTKVGATGPAFPGSENFISGQGNSGGRIVEKPFERTTSLPGSPQAEPGAIPDMGWAKTKTGLVPVPSSDVKQRIEDNMPHEWSHFYRNNVYPDTQPPKSALPKGASDWKWNQLRMEWQPRYPEGKPKTRDTYNDVRRSYQEGA